MDPAEAIEAVKQVKPDVFVMDVKLPGMSGVELYDRLRRDDPTRDVPVLFETVGDVEAAGELRRRGVAAYVRKPFDINEVVAFVKMLAGQGSRALGRETLG
jgi:CheY-like chemotaxis protein